MLLSANIQVVWGRCDDIDGGPRRTGVCVNDFQSLYHQLLKKGEGGAKLEYVEQTNCVSHRRHSTSIRIIYFRKAHA